MMKRLMTRLMLIFIAILLTTLAACQKANQVDLADTAWKLSELNGEKPIEGKLLTLVFEGDQISGTAGCNHYGGNYSLDGEQISFDSVYNTEMACQSPEGVMSQEQAYLDALRNADQISLIDNTLLITSSTGATLKYEPDDPNSDSVVSTEVDDTVQVQQTTAAPEVENETRDTPSWAYHTYRDELTGITILIPDSWIVTGIIEGDYAILQSYPKDKYIGGEPREAGDTKCDLNIKPDGTNVESMIEGWKSDPMTTILTEGPFEFANGVEGARYEINNMGELVAFVVELDGRVVVLSCFGNFDMVDDIAATLSEGE